MMRRFVTILACGLLSAACQNDSALENSEPQRGTAPNVTGAGQNREGRDHSVGGINGMPAENSGANSSGRVDPGPNPTGRDNNGTSSTGGQSAPGR